MRRIAARGDGFCERLARFLKFLFVEVHFAEFFKIRGGGIIQNVGFEFLDASPSAKALKRSLQQSKIRNPLDHQIRSGTNEAAENNNVKPIAFRTAPEEMDQRNDLDDESPRIKKMAEREHNRPRRSFSLN